MACACKAERKEPKMNIQEAFKKKKGTMFILNMIKEIIGNILTKVFIICLFVILTPLIMLNLIISFIFTNRLQITIPKKMIMLLKNLDNHE